MADSVLPGRKYRLVLQLVECKSGNSSPRRSPALNARTSVQKVASPLILVP